ncbi:hypothetical protein LUZ60_017520 [Juncus effusus]|nr:hypothetical protein LUZ60_017520 [Juncus effusus]
MELYLEILSGALPGLFLLLLIVFLYRHYRRNRGRSFKLNPTNEIQKPDIEKGLPKLPIPFKPNSIRDKTSLQFHQLHKEVNEIGEQLEITPFYWAYHPNLITEATENGWPCFAFNDMNQKAESGTWEIRPDSSELMQAVRLNPSEKSSSSSVGTDINSNNNFEDSISLCGVKMSLPLPGPLLNGFPFPQEAYFEISIMYIKSQDKKEKWYVRASRKVRESGEGDKTKLISGGNTSMIEDTIKAIKEERLVRDEEERERNKKHKNSKNILMSIGLSVGVNMSKPALPGSYPGSIGFHSDGSLYLDGMKLVSETEKHAWADLERTIGCGFDPVKKKVIFTLDSKVVHSINCQSQTYSCPLYPILTSNTDTMFLVNLGQAKFKYKPANIKRTANPCFVRSNSEASSTVNTHTGFGFEDDSGELFSVGRVDSGWSDIVRKNMSKKNSVQWNDGERELEGDSDFFEIPLKD